MDLSICLLSLLDPCPWFQVMLAIPLTAGTRLSPWEVHLVSRNYDRLRLVVGKVCLLGRFTGGITGMYGLFTQHHWTDEQLKAANGQEKMDSTVRAELASQGCVIWSDPHHIHGHRSTVKSWRGMGTVKLNLPKTHYT